MKAILAWARAKPETIAAIGIFAVVYGILLTVSPFERSVYSIQNFSVLLAPLAMAAFGTCLVLITGGFDLSVAGTISLASALTATWFDGQAGPPWAKLALIVLIGAVAGMVNGLLVSFGLQSLAVSVATFTVLSGLALVTLRAPGGNVPPDLIKAVNSGVAHVPLPLVFLIVAGLAWWAFTRTRTGTAAFAIGADMPATILSGVKVRGVQITVYTSAGCCYALAGIFLAAGSSSGDPGAGRPFMLSAFAAMALGLVSFRGGRGSAVAAMFGAGTVTALPKMLFAVGIADFWTGICQGAVILVALAIPLLVSIVGDRRKLARAVKAQAVEVTP
ncbi:MAG: ABC transporter permease [Micrococcales bacterium]|nr:ABC transporter permease [Micrococcales bacterium]